LSIENAESQLRKNINKNKFENSFRRISNWVNVRKTKSLVVFFWTLAIASAIVLSYWLVYLQNPILIKYIMIFTEIEQWIPRLSTIGYIIIFITSMIAGAVLADFEDILYAWLAVNFLSLISSILYMFFFVWFSLGAGAYFHALGIAESMFEWVMFYVGVNIFWMYFPIILLFSFGGGFLGAILRSILSPKA